MSMTTVHVGEALLHQEGLLLPNVHNLFLQKLNSYQPISTSVVLPTESHVIFICTMTSFLVCCGEDRCWEEALRNCVPWRNAVSLERESRDSVRTGMVLILCRTARTN